MMFFHFSQNNSGGSFDFDEDRGITHHVVIEAKSKDHASAIAQDIGIYFDGVRKGMDCGCCGDRWYEPYADGDDTPKVYGKSPETYDSMFMWMDEGKEICVHYLDGRMEWFGPKKGKSKKSRKEKS